MLLNSGFWAIRHQEHSDSLNLDLSHKQQNEVDYLTISAHWLMDSQKFTTSMERDQWLRAVDSSMYNKFIYENLAKKGMV